MTTQELNQTRRDFLSSSGIGLGSLALAALQAADAAAERSAPLAPRVSHFAPRAKNVINLFMVGGPSQLDMYDDKPALRRHDGEEIPPSLMKGVRFEQIRDSQPKVMGSRWRFRQCGESGAPMSELVPYMSEIVDDIAFVRSVTTDETVHPHAQLLMLTGHRDHGRPSLGSWVTYGLGSESHDLPAFVAYGRGAIPQAHDSLHGNGFLSSAYHGVKLRNQGAPILNLENPPGVSSQDTEQVIRAINKLNEIGYQRTHDPETPARISSYELAYRMQASAPELVDLSDESQATLDLYGAKADEPSFNRDCLLARRLVERGVRFVQLHHGDWDDHGDIVQKLPANAKAVDQPCAALVRDLKERGLLEDTLVSWGGEFGRTPVAQPQENANIGRDHHIHAFTMWMAGGGIRPGISVGGTDDFGFHPTTDSVHVHDLQATILHLLGLDHERLTYRFQGREFRLTDVYGKVVSELIV